MARRKDQKLEELLQQVGFTPIASAANLFAFQPGESHADTKCLWNVSEWVVRKTSSAWTTERLVLELSRERLAEAFQAAVREEHGPGALVELAEGDRDYWVMLEFIRPRSKHLVPVSITNMSHVFNSPHGAGGFRFHLAIDRDQLILQVYDQFALGYVPPRFFFRHTAMLVPLLGLESSEQNNFFEQRYDLFSLLKNILINYCDQPATVQELWQSFSDRQQKFRSKSTLQTEMDSAGIRLVVDTEAQPQVGVRRPNIEVLESRELKERFGDLDQMLLSDSWMDAVAACRAALTTAESPMYLLRRLALLSLSSRTVLTPEELDTALSIEPRNRLFLSCAIKQTQTQRAEATEDLLAIVSEIGESLYEEVRYADHLKTLDVVLPELLGDCWFVKDPKMAEACYQRVVKKRGNMPRVLTKLAWLARSQGLRQQEIDILVQLLPVERRKNEMAHIHLRLAQLYQGVSAEEVVKHALASLTFLPDNLDAVNLVCDTLLQSGRAPEAIQVLTDALERLDHKDESDKRADLEIAIGEIWESHLGRRDLARERYQRALNLAHSERTYRRLAEIFAQLQEVKLHAEALLGLIDLYALDRQEDMRSVADELVQIYLHELSEPEKAFLLYRKLHAVKPLPLKDLAMILQWPEFSADWAGFYRELLESAPSFDSPQDQFIWQTYLGDFCRYRCDENERAAQHYLLALKAGVLDSHHFDFMIHHWQITQQWVSMIEAFRVRMGQVPDAERWGFMKLMLQHPEFLGQEEADRFAASLVVHGQGDEGAFIQRVRTHLHNNHLGAIELLAQHLAAELKHPDLLHRHLKAIILEVQGARGPQKHHVVNSLLNLLLNAGMERREYLRLATQLLADAAPEMALPILKETLDDGTLPPANMWKEERVLALLDREPLYRARYHMLRSEVSGDPGDAVRQGYNAWRILQPLEGHEDIKWRLLSQLAPQVPMADAEWNYMTELARARKSFEPLLRALQERVIVARTRDEKERLLRRVIDVEWNDRRSMMDTLSAYHQWAGIAEDAISALMEALQFARAEGQIADWYPVALELLRHPQAMRRPEAFFKVLNWTLESRSSEEKVPTWLLQNVERMLREQRDHASVRCAELCRQHEVADFSLTLASLDYYLSLGMNAASQEAWVYGLGLTRNSKEMLDYLTQALQLFRSHRRLEQWDVLLRHSIQNGHGLPLAPDLLEELILFAACQLFVSQKELPLVFEILKDFFQRSPHDPRTWSPLHALHRDLGDQREQMSFLTMVVAMIAQDETLVCHMPVAIDVLRHELQTLQQQFKAHSVTEQPVVAQSHEQSQAQVMSMDRHRAPSVAVQPPLPRVAGDGFSTPLRSKSNVKPMMDASREEYVDWRLWVRRRHTQKNMTQDLMLWAFENEVEKHVAVQAFAALTGEFAPLRDWQYKVWRDFAEPPYHLEGKNRLYREAANPLLSNDLSRLLQILAPAIASVFPQVFSEAPLLSRFKVTRQRLQATAQPLPWDHPVLRKAGLTHFAERFSKERISLLHLGPMQDDVFFDYYNRDIYLNMDAALTRPLSHLRHRILKYYRATRLNFYVPLSVSMQSQLIPFLKAAHAALQRRGLDSLAVNMGLRSDPVAVALQKVERERAKDLFAKIARQGLSELGPTLRAMSNQIYHINFAETLDLIGLLEEVFGLDLAAPLSPEATRALQSSELLQTLLDLSVILRLE